METIKRPLFFAAPIWWYAGWMGADEVLIVDEMVFPEKTFRNKLEFTGVAGMQSFTIPLNKSSRKLPYRQVEISYQEHWQNQLVNALRTAYGKSPFFEYYDYRIEPVIKKNHRYLFDLNLELLKTTLFCLKMDAALRISEPGPVFMSEDLTPKMTIPYYQVFADKNGFQGGLSILDLLFNEGLNAGLILNSDKFKVQ